jgi:hypothetical protein
LPSQFVLQPQFTELALETAEKNKIPNAQSKELSHQDLLQVKDIEKKWGEVITPRSGPTPIYNCHGLVFASRRTGIFDNSSIRQIFEDDRYREIKKEDALPGDIVIYFNKGDIEHSAIIINAPSESLLKIPLVYSKWGKYSEVIHLQNQCPYNLSEIKYYRVVR